MQTTKRKLSILNVILIVITVSALAVAGYFWYQSQTTNKLTDDQQTEVLAPIFIPLKPFTVSLPTVQNGFEINKVLYIGMVIRVKNENQHALVLKYLPEVRNEILLLLLKQNINQLQQEAGQRQLQQMLKQSLSRQYDGKQMVNIEEVLFTDFIIR